MHIVNVIVSGDDPRFAERMPEQRPRIDTKYQFILRLYPTLDSILGGFDLGCSMVAYDGREFLATPLGAFTLINSMIIVDISRRSTTFGRRLSKYRDRGFSIAFPGFAKDVNFQPEQKSQKEAIKRIKELAREFNLDFRAYTNTWDYDGRTDPPEKLSIEKAFGGSHEVRFLDFTVWRDGRVIQNPRVQKDDDQYEHDLADYGPAASYQMECSNLSAIMNGINEGVLVKAEYVPGTNFDAMWDDLIHRPVIIALSYFSASESENMHRYDEKRVLMRRYGQYHKDLDAWTDSWHQRIKYIRQNRLNEMTDKLIGIRWITENPGRQWTSSVNPAIVDARVFYGEFYTPAYAIISPDVEMTLRLMRLRRDSPFFRMPRDMFNLIIMAIPFVKGEQKSN